MKTQETGASGVPLPSHFLLVSVVRFQGGVDEELIEDVPLEENKQNKCKPMSKRPPSRRLAAPLLNQRWTVCLCAGQPSSGTNFHVRKNTDCWRSHQHP